MVNYELSSCKAYTVSLDVPPLRLGSGTQPGATSEIQAQLTLDQSRSEVARTDEEYREMLCKTGRTKYKNANAGGGSALFSVPSTVPKPFCVRPSNHGDRGD